MPGQHRLPARGDASQRTPVTRSELAQQGRNVTLYRPDRDEEPGANLSIGQMLGDTLEHLGLPGRHTRRRPSLPHLLDSPRCRSWRQRRLLAGGAPNPKDLRRGGHTQPAPSTFIEPQPAHANERAAVKTSPGPCLNGATAAARNPPRPVWCARKPDRSFSRCMSPVIAQVLALAYGQGAQVPRCLAAHEPRGGDLRVPGHRRCVTKDTGNRACRPARPGRPGAASTRWRTQDCPDYRRCRIGDVCSTGAFRTANRCSARDLPWDDHEPAERPGWMLHTGG